MQLTKTLLRLDFGLKIELPPDRLCPPVPNRHNYILWLKDLLDTTTYNSGERQEGRISGLDVGTGASCIYPLLGCAQRAGWCFLATDIDDKNLASARANVQRNGLQQRVRVLARRADQPLVPLDELGADSIDFVMANPPFYESEAEMAAAAAKKARPPLSACTGAPVEMVCAGGEVAFVRRLMRESAALRRRVRWYSSMLGKMSSLEAVVDALRELGVDNYAVTEFVQGSKTRRWAVAWSFGAMRPTQDTARGMKALAWKKILPPVVEFDICVLDSVAVEGFVGRLTELVRSLELVSWEWDVQRLSGVGRARENVWGRAWRRKKIREEQGKPTVAKAESKKEEDGDDDDEDEDDEHCAFGFMVSVSVGLAETKAVCRWVEGHDESIFQSFCGFLKARLKAG